MTYEVQQMQVGEFAEARIALGERVKRLGAAWWRCSKRVFYRPLLAHEAYAFGKSDLPSVTLGGFQYLVADERQANSAMGFLMLQRVGDYSLDTLDHNRRRLIRNAAKIFGIRPMEDLSEFKDEGFRVYSSFHERTHYRYKSARTRRENYAQWAEATFRFKKSVILGGYDQTGRLGAISISYWVNETLIYSTFFSDTGAYAKGVGELMFHTLREIARGAPGIRRVCVRRYQGGNGMDRYYLLRGAELLIKPARVQIHPVTKWILKLCFPAQYVSLGEGLRTVDLQATGAML